MDKWEEFASQDQLTEAIAAYMQMYPLRSYQRAYKDVTKFMKTKFTIKEK